MSGIYTVQFNAVAVTATQDLFEIVASSGKPLVILGWEISQYSDVGDAQEELIPIYFKSGQTVSGSGGSSVTPAAGDTSLAAASFTAEANNTTKANTGTILTHYSGSWNVRMPYEKIFTPEQQIVIIASRRCTLELGANPADSLTCNGTIWVQEIG